MFMWNEIITLLIVAIVLTTLKGVDFDLLRCSVIKKCVEVKEASQKRSSKKDTSDKPQRSSHRKSSEGSKICAFDLLASIADKLSQESESSTSITSPEQKDQITLSKESPHSGNDSGLEHVSDVKTNVKLEPCEIVDY
uniref:Uncharacterized protein n=2 Tax=Lactuca sativa TaxID=4236 RepID=A0A9R1XNH5_LACSA|nr:hypothetical protein LSAT_V11C200054530 [Lactuca sativa]KAJ0223974.1 hypothetical protein LSAT_V11C200096330 [Lactuca sativa]